MVYKIIHLSNQTRSRNDQHGALKGKNPLSSQQDLIQANFELSIIGQSDFAETCSYVDTLMHCKCVCLHYHIIEDYCLI